MRQTGMAAHDNASIISTVSVTYSPCCQNLPHVSAVEIKPEKVLRYLGILLDSNVTGLGQVRRARKKTATLLAVLASIARLTWGQIPDRFNACI
jgi:hypothetical protein